MKLIVLLIPCLIFAFDGKVVKVTDGDTITVLTNNNTQVKVRLHGIDAPEKKQAYGQVSTKNLSELCAGENAKVEEKGKDRYKRVLGIVTCKGIEANKRQVQDGLAWAYVQYSKDYVEYEQKAKDAKRGLWQDKDPTPPWIWRKKK
jgi:endonuclease YncB( thermonuclease family)